MGLDSFFGYSILNEFDNLDAIELVILATEASIVWMFLDEDSQDKLEELMVQVELTRRSSKCRTRNSAKTWK